MLGSKKIIFPAAVLIIAAGLGWFFLAGNDTEAPGGDNRIPLPDLFFRDYEGQEIKLADFRGRPMVVNTWASWCPFCVEELPVFASAQEEIGDQITFVLINRAETLQAAQRFSGQVGVTGRLVLLLDPADSFYKSIGGFSMPETIFVDKEGFIIQHKRGPMPLEEIRRRIKEAFGL